MKKLKDIVRTRSLKSTHDAYVPDEPIHFKMRSDDAYVPDEPIHFKMDSNKTKINEDIEKKPKHIYDWINHNENSAHGKNDDDIANKLVKHTQSLNLSDKTKKHVHQYTKDSKSLNLNLVKQHKEGNPHKFTPTQNDRIKHLDAATNNHIGHKLHLYSGLGFNPKEKLGKSGHLHMPAYTSMTHSKSVAKAFAEDRSNSSKNKNETEHHILHIETDKKDKGLHTSHISNYKGEHETILPRNTKLKVNPKPTTIVTKGSAWSPKVTHHIWHAKIEHQD